MRIFACNGHASTSADGKRESTTLWESTRHTWFVLKATTCSSMSCFVAESEKSYSTLFSQSWACMFKRYLETLFKMSLPSVWCIVKDLTCCHWHVYETRRGSMWIQFQLMMCVYVYHRLLLRHLTTMNSHMICVKGEVHLNMFTLYIGQHMS
jgi:hypothetical protein